MDTPVTQTAILENGDTPSGGSLTDSSATIETSTSDQSAPGTEASKVVDWEKRYKDTQAAYTKSQQKLVATQAELEVVKKSSTNKLLLSEADQSRLDELKYSDPDAWRTELGNLEKQHEKQIADQVANKVTELSELEQREVTLQKFMDAHPGFELNDDIIAYDVPPRITNKLKSGELTFEQYLSEVLKYLETPKVIGTNNQTLGQPNLSSTGGDDTPTRDNKPSSDKSSYSKEIY